ncbi:hypothetical protein M9H77_06775 [Catharanthus roseus]|uniref:Uncharacterized protein n=1 Tax=Catharanthus roseus TaxID=4058 RepID=A0ACC0BT67_CATRO|nr:hypothetical protein M9H77_06775 [Catharanthus roseus]
MENEYEFNFLNSLGNFFEKKHFIEFNSLSCVIPRVDEYYDNVANYASCVLGIEDEGRGEEKELGNYLEDLPISPFLNPSLSFYEVSFEELKKKIFKLLNFLNYSLSLKRTKASFVIWLSRMLIFVLFLKESLWTKGILRSIPISDTNETKREINSKLSIIP